VVISIGFTPERGTEMRRIAAVLVLAAALAAAAPASASPSRIVGGEPAAFAAWPWQVGILDASAPDSYFAQFCGGTLIAPGVVLTAGHCMYDSHGHLLEAADVITGTSLLGGSFGDRAPVVGGIVSGYDEENMWNPDDLAVLWVGHTSPRAIPLPAATFAQWHAFRVGSLVTVAGWGVNRIAGPRGYMPRKLKQYVGIVRTKAKGFLLVRSLTSSACFGDSGGPAVGRDATGAPYLVGVVHAGRLDCAVGHSAMFVSVATQQQFIQQALAAGPPQAGAGDGPGKPLLRRAG